MNISRTVVISRHGSCKHGVMGSCDSAFLRNISILSRMFTDSNTKYFV